MKSGMGAGLELSDLPAGSAVNSGLREADQVTDLCNKWEQ